MPKGMTGKIWSSVISKLALIGMVSVLFYIIGDSFHLVPQSLKDAVSFLAGNLNTFAFVFCFTIGAYVFLRILQTRRGEHHQ